MIGFFIFDEKPTVSNSLVKGHLALNQNIEGVFYVRSSDCADICSVNSGDRFFGILDESSGYGACLFIEGLDVESNNLLAQKNLHVKQNLVVDGQITGASNNTSMTLTPDHLALLAGSLAPTILSGITPTESLILSNYNLEMTNGG